MAIEPVTALRRLAGVCRAMEDYLGAARLFEATATAARQAVLLRGDLDEGHATALSRSAACRLLEDQPPDTVTRGDPNADSEPDWHQLIADLDAAAPDERGVPRDWPAAEARHRQVSASLERWVASATRMTSESSESLLRLALAALGEIASLPVPRLLVPRAPIGRHASDKPIYLQPGATQPLQDGGWAYDLAVVYEQQLALAKVVLPAAECAEYYRRLADECFWRGDVPRALSLIRESLDKHPNAASHNCMLRYLLASPSTDEESLFAESRRWARLYAREDSRCRRFANSRDPDRVLRVAYVCDFAFTSLAQHTILPQFELHDRSRVKVYYYNTGSPSPVINPYVDVCREVHAHSDEALFRCIQDDQIDVLIDLNGRLRHDFRHGVFCRKPAPLLLNWYNLLSTTGLAAYDYVVADAVSLPLRNQPHFTEQICHLPSIGSWRLPDEPPVERQPALHKGYVTFGSFGAAFKSNDDVLDTWTSVMQALPEAQLFLKNIQFYTPAFRVRVEERFAAAGVGVERLRLEHGSQFEPMRGLYRHVDLALDTFPYNNGSTNVLALWQGVPVLTLAGDDFRSRVTMSMLEVAGLSEFIAEDRRDYVAKARHYHDRPDYLAEIRSGMRERLRARSGYYQLERFTRAFEDAMREMWRRWLAETAA